MQQTNSNELCKNYSRNWNSNDKPTENFKEVTESNARLASTSGA